MRQVFVLRSLLLAAKAATTAAAGNPGDAVAGLGLQHPYKPIEALRIAKAPCSRAADSDPH